ncbi:uncharacterized protein A4U43_C01F35650 [Asparagus officinalis]|uniref:Major facilitator superfamily (MFS) profile domain-containing protein n=1 Tax=Asparagus officinalis TaxID=4686 RepID=A0A5P1FVF9_ASPOF|nr:organic cation/carnitine transporter 7-like [Asparagus officinalis]ONK82054.1 uncharacterized protein A4U43_C01F35650 [Asparagus officinalis]
MGDEGSPPSYTVDDALGSTGFGKFQALALAYSGVGYAAEAMEVMLLSFIGGPLREEWGLTSGQESLITSVVFVGMMVGASSWGVVSDNYGRRKGFLFTALVTCGAGFLGAFAPNYISFVVLRFMVGIGLGGGSVLLSWFLEFVPTNNRGTWMIVFTCFWSVGTVLEASLAWAVMPRLGWRWLLALSALPSFLLLLFYGVAPESPRYLCMKGRTDEAVDILQRVARVNHKPLPYGKLVSECKVELDEKLNPSECAHLIPVQNNKTANEDAKSKTRGIRALRSILSPPLIRSTLLLWMDFFGNVFAYYGVSLLTTELVTEKRCSVMLNSSLSESSGPYKDVFITSFAEFPGFLLSAAIVDRVGRKLSMLAMLSICGIFLMPLIFHQSEVLTTALLFGARICIAGSFNTLYIYAPEIYPTSIRSTGFGIANSIGRIGGIVCPLVAVGLVEGCHQMEAVLLFELVIFLSAMAVSFFPFETKGRELSDFL